MSNSLQNWVGRNRPPRVQITYDVEIGDAVEKKELPLVVGLLADLSGQPAQPLPKLKERRFVEIDRDNFDEVLGNITPRLDLSVPDTMKGEGNLKIELNFKEFSDFHPEAIVDQVPRLAKLLEARQQLRDLLAKLDGNDELDDLLERVLLNTEDLKTVQSQARAEAGSAAAQAAPAAAAAPQAAAETQSSPEAEAPAA
ncbi:MULTISPECIES: type VI secretion system contractile sheath small subunit [unclassified Variovorax]|jgi:type VI secretion system protein ImpB|uniref:type VI secretion system contractile sheath small subunit n=1 Tax=unclassified Variovorax TaxID=663243 RepID=UPI00089454E2|nr:MULTISPECIES: type VI secretion system contractile sheath small subunit [unclassified Variovorax]SDZ05063.1 type VI secretion system protein ImpB [Variovorax sp. YR634]SOD29384.1 type VI secretion system protein ImpB [Variovorax sp. YR752]